MSDYKRISDALHAAIDTGNRDYADEAASELLHGYPEITNDQRDELLNDYYGAVNSGEI